MKKPEKFDPTSHTFSDDRLTQLWELCPEAFTEQGIDFERLKTLLGEKVEVGSERYSFTWPGKTEAIRAAQVSSMGTLVPDKESSVDWDTTKNLYLEGDNLEILKLLQKSYIGKVKMIYIDPPYNTGKDFVYPDKYGEGLKTYLEYTGQIDGEGKKLTTNTETDGRYHSRWLNMMYPRLMLARNLLKDDGVIFVSIDDHEFHNLHKIMDEVFGAENFIGNTIWYKKRKGSFLSDEFVSLTEYILIYKKRDLPNGLHGGSPEGSESQPIVKRTNSQKTLSFKTGTVKTKLKNGTYKVGVYGDGSSAVELLNDVKVSEGYFLTEFALKGPFTWNQGMLDSELESGSSVVINTLNFQPRVYRNYSDDDHKGFPSFLDGREFSATTDDAYEELRTIFSQEKVFDYSKPWQLIEKLITAVCWNDLDAIVLDFFSGSGTAAHAVIALNTADGGNRHFILTQLQEPLDSENRDHAVAAEFCRSIGKPMNIAEIGKERIRRAATQIRKDYVEKISSRETPLDTGFKTYRLASSTFNVWDTKVEDNVQEKLELATSLIHGGAKEEDILSELILKSGFGLVEKVEQVQIDGKKLYVVAEGKLIISLETGLTLPIVRAIAERKPVRFVARERGFASDDVLANTAQILKDKGIDFRVL